LLTLIIAAQLVAPPPPPSPPPQRVQAPNPTNAPAPLSAAECKCSIEVFVKRLNGEAIGDVDLTVTMASGATAFIQAPAAATGATPASLTATNSSPGSRFPRELNRIPTTCANTTLLGTGINVTAGLAQSIIQITPIPSKH
jgi:hypothetical protein